MLRYLGHFYQLLAVVVTVFVGLLGHNLVQAWVAVRLGDREPARQRFTRLDLRKHLEPLGAVAVFLAYFGWGFAAAVPITARFRRQRGRATVALASGPLFLLGWTYGMVALLRLAERTTNVHLGEFAVYAATTSAGLFVLSLLPVPPLTGGRLLFLYAPTSPGWQRARYRLTETTAGPLIALAIVLLPVLFPLLPDIVGELADPLLRALGHSLHVGDPVA